MFRRYSPFDDLFSIFRGFDNVYRPSLADQPGSSRLLAGREGTELAETAQPSWYPAVETFTRKGDIVLRAELPGVDPKDLEVTVEKGRLLVSGEKREEKRSNDDSVFMREVTYGRFERVFVLPEGVKPEQVKASFRNGVLEVSLPAKGAVPESRRIPVDVGKEKSIKVA